MDFFQLLEMPKGFGVDLVLLENKYLEVSRKRHPDFAHEQGDPEVLFLSAQVNLAYTTLKDPLTRGEYLLRLEGNPAVDSQRTVDPEVLEEVMEIRSEMANPESRKKNFELAKNRVETLEKQLLNLFSKIEFLGGDEKNKGLVRVRILLNGLRYYQNLIRDLSQGA